MNRRRLVAAATVSSVVAVLVASAAMAAFTDEESNPQQVTAADRFPGVGPDVTAQSASDNPSETSQISLRLQVTNTGDQPLDLRQVTMRYWFTNDYGTAGLGSRCNYVPPPLDCSAVSRSTGLVEPARVGADRYLQLGFGSGSLAPGAATGAIQVQVYRASGGDPFDQSDDHSHTTRTSLGDAPNVAVYVDDTLAWGTEPASRPAAPGLRVRYTDLDGDPTNATMNPGLIVDNTGAVPLSLGQVKLRYWFSQQPGGATFQTFCDYAVSGCEKLTHTVRAAQPSRPGADHYLEVGFAPSSLPAGSSTGEVRLRANQSDYAKLDETDDYSHGATGPFRPWEKVTGYLEGTLLWGTPP